MIKRSRGKLAIGIKDQEKRPNTVTMISQDENLEKYNKIKRKKQRNARR